MTKDADFVYVDIYGDEVARDDPAAQAKYNAADLKAMRRGGFFAKRDGDAAPAEVDEAKGTPVLNSGLGAAAEDDESADEKPAARTKAK
jgi:hypothetical protein